MAYNSNIKLWESEFNNTIFTKDKLQDLNFNQSKLEIHETYKKDEKITTHYDPINNEYVINKAYQDEKMLKISVQISLLEKEYN